MQLLDFFLREEGTPAWESVVAFSEDLRADAPARLRRDPSFRSPESVRVRLYYLRLLAREEPQARHRVPQVFREVWNEFARESRAPYRGAGPTQPVKKGGAVKDREALTAALGELHAVLEEVVEEGTEWFPEDLLPTYVAAWRDLEERGYFGQAMDLLRGPSVDDYLRAHGLLGLQRKAKTEPLSWATRMWRSFGGRKRLKAVLGYADVLLGSLIPVMPWFEPVREFKEGVEASVQVAFPDEDSSGSG